MHTLTPIFFVATLFIFFTPAQGTVTDRQLAPDFSLESYAGEQVSLGEFSDKIVVLEWFAHDCAFTADHYDDGEGHMQLLQDEFGKKGVLWLTIDSNRNALPANEMNALYDRLNMKSTAFLSDITGQVGRLYGVVTTPQMFVINQGTIVYQGAIDDRSSFLGFAQNRASAKNYVRLALEAVLQNKSVEIAQTKPYGCGMKYRK